MKRWIMMLALALATTLFTVACDKGATADDSHSHDGADEAHKMGEMKPGMKMDGKKMGEMKPGMKMDGKKMDGVKKIDPPIAVAEVPNGHWMCEMGGTSHYHSADKGDGKCPVCGMFLEEKK